MTQPPDYLRRIWDDAAAKLDEMLLPGTTVSSDETPLTVVKHPAYLMLSDDAAMDAGLIPDTRPRARIPWRTRLRWRISAWRERVGRKIGGWIAGVDLSERDDW